MMDGMTQHLVNMVCSTSEYRPEPSYGVRVEEGESIRKRSGRSVPAVSRGEHFYHSIGGKQGILGPLFALLQCSGELLLPTGTKTKNGVMPRGSTI